MDREARSMSLKVAFVKTGSKLINTALVYGADSQEELQATFDREITPPDEPRMVLRFVSFEGMVPDALDAFLKNGGDNTIEKFEQIIDDLLGFRPFSS